MKKLFDWIRKKYRLAVSLALTLLLLLGQLACVFQQGEVFSKLAPISPIFSKATPRPTRSRAVRVVSVTPADGSEGVKDRANIEVTFDQPMVDLKAKKHPVPVDIQPAAEGSSNSRWIAENVYRFAPRGLAPATHYTVTVLAGTTSLAGSKLREDYSVTFSTKRPAIRSTIPIAGAQSVDPGGAVTIKFDQPMNPGSVESRFMLVDALDQTVKGRFSWRDSHTMAFIPEGPLDRSSDYRAELAAGALAVGKEMGIAETHSWQFTVAGRPHIVSSSPDDGDMEASLDGKLVLEFNVPMDSDSVEEALHITPEPEQVDFRWSRNRTRLEAHATFDPSSEYRVLMSGAVKDRYGDLLTGNRSIVFRCAPLEPRLSLYGPHGYYRGAVGSYVADHAIEQYVEVLNVDEVSFSLSSIEPMDFMMTYRDRYEGPDHGTITRTLVHEWSQPFDIPLNKTRFEPAVIADADGQLPPGVYLLEARAGELYDARFMIVSRANLALKWGPRQVFVWATDVINGEVIPGMRVAVYEGDGTLLAEGVTDDDGVFVAQIEDLSKGEYWYRWEESVFAIGEGPHGLAMCSNRWDQGIAVYDFGLQRDDGGGGTAAAYLYSDRPIYRPGQTVYYKGIVRADDDGRYAPLGKEYTTVPVDIQDSRGNELFSGELPLTEFGTFNGELKLSDAAPLGQYTIQVGLSGGSEPQRLTFTVSEYRKPEFKVEVSTGGSIAGDAPSAYVIHGETVTFTVQADYYFGQPVANAPVRWTVRGSSYRFSLRGEWYNFGRYTDGWWYYGEDRYDEGSMIYDSGEGRTDENGRFVIDFPVDLSHSEVSQVLFVEAVLVDSSDQEVAGSTVVVAHKTDTYLGIRPHRYVGAPGKPHDIHLVTLDPLREPKGDLPVTIELYHRRWDTVREKTDSGGYVWRNTLTEELIATQVVTPSSVDGRATTTVTPPEGGSYKVVARAVDGLGNEVESSTRLWVWSRDYVNWGINNHNRIQLVADKNEYEPGDVAEILVTAPFTGCLALITVERGGVLSHEVQRLDTTGALLRVPILADYAPNAFLSVSLLKAQGDGFSAPSFKLGYIELRVARRQQQLDVTVTSDKERYLPGETATYNIRVTDYLGKPVTAELSVGVVDAAVLALLGDNAEPILDAFYHRRGIGVWNAQTLVIGVERLNEELVEKGKGGGGGGEGDGVRRFFLDTAYWAPAVVTDWDGRAVVQVPLPDDLTTWRLRTKGITVDTRVGDGSTDVISTKDLLVRPVLPRFFTVGDKATVAALVHNYTPLTQTVQVEMQTTGLEVVGGKGASTVVIGPGSAEKVAWQVTVPKVREVKVLFSAWATEAPARDAVEITLPVHAYAEMVPIAANEPVPLDEGDGERLTVTVELPDDTSEMDELIIETAPSMGAGIRTGLEYLTGYPYG